VTYGLIAANIVVFVWELIVTNSFDSCLTSQLFYSYGLVPFGVLNGNQLSVQCTFPQAQLYGVYNPPAAYFTLLSSMFLHVSVLHILGNMIFLFVFGPNIEVRFGRVKYLATYLVSGIAGAAATVVAALWTGSNLYVPELGASAAISGVLAAYLVLLPRGKILSIIGFFLIPISAYWFIGGWFVLQVLYQLGGIDTGVAYVAHIGGFAMGLVPALLIRGKVRGPQDYDL
jgi:membrane associated rhomboid family serine protease